ADRKSPSFPVSESSTSASCAALLTCSREYGLMTRWRTLAGRPSSIVTAERGSLPLLDQPRPGLPSIRFVAFQLRSLYSLVKSLILPPFAARATLPRAGGPPGPRTSAPITSALFSSIQLPPSLRRKVKRT